MRWAAGKYPWSKRFWKSSQAEKGIETDTLKVMVVITAILILVRFRVPLSATLLGSAAALGFLFKLSIPQVAAGFFKGAVDYETLMLIASFILILFFSAIMKETGRMTQAISALQEIFRDARATVAIIPAIIGILPIMGGAMLSAPLVLEASDELNLSPERRTFLNYWFRHIWEYMLPTYPVILLISTIVGIPLSRIVLMNLPLSVAAIATGVALGFRGVHPPPRLPAPLTPGNVLRAGFSFVANLLPFLAVLVLILIFKVHLAYSLAFASLAVLLYSRPPGSLICRLLKLSFSLELIFLLLGIMIFKEILSTTGAIDSVARDFTRMGMPPLVLIIALPALLGLITGFANALVGLGFPILLPFLQNSDAAVVYAMLAYLSGYCAVLLSPMHICLVMTMEFFHADLSKVYRLLILPVTLVVLTGAGVAVIFLWGVVGR
jgi:hypothetical protein